MCATEHRLEIVKKQLIRQILHIELKIHGGSLLLQV